MFQNYYRRRGQLQGHFGAIYSLVATDDGKLLASGGNDGTRIWNLAGMVEISTRPATWINRDDEPGDILVYGTINGYLVTWQQSAGQEGFHEVFCRQLTQPSEVTALAFDTPSGRLAVCTYNSVVQVYAMRSSSPPQKLFAVNIDNFVPKSIHFGAIRGNEREILVFGGRDGKMRLHLDQYLGDRQLLGAMGNWRLHYGAVLYRLHDHRQIKKFPVPVRYGDDSKVIVIGSNHGIVYVYDRRSGELVAKLLSKGQDWVQTIATADCNGVPTIFAAKSGEDGGRNDIVVWRKAVASMLLASLGLVYQNRNLLEEIIRYKLANFSPQT
ncbi:WD40-repeat-containing domain protein [Mycena leptocephala]|nr:WD40-repeat-containing domain protein [Mycena leptocephala]